MLIAEIRPFSNGFLCVGGRGGLGRGKCTGKESWRDSDVSQVPACISVYWEMDLKCDSIGFISKAAFSSCF